MKHIIQYKQTCIMDQLTSVEVEADNVAEALKLAEEGHGTEIDSYLNMSEKRISDEKFDIEVLNVEN